MTPRRAGPRGAQGTGLREQVTIERVVAGGDGLARLADGRVVFVPGALPGERADIEIVEAKRDFARGRIGQLIDVHDGRTSPPCPALRRGCGGCDWQHADVRLQLEMKVEIVREALQRTGKIESPVVVAAGAVPPWAYRTTMRFSIDGDGHPALHRSRSNSLVRLDDCLVAHPRLSELVPVLRLPGADEVTARVSAATGERTVWWSGEVSGAEVPSDVRTGADASLVEVVDGVELRVSMASFFQSGPDAASLLVRTVHELSGDALTSAGHVVDAYGGVGLFASTLPAAVAARITLVESSSVVCADALHNLRDRDVAVVCSSVEEWTPVRADIVIVDPARQGLGREAVERIAETGAPTIVLVSCDPVSLARDVTLMRAAGYDAGPAHVLDLFPQTHHVEVVTRFDRR